MLDAAVWAVAAAFAGMGVVALVAPGRIPAYLGERLETADGRSEVRAVYGGFGLAVAGVLVAAVTGEGGVREGILVAVGFALAGMAAGRLLSALADGPVSVWPVWGFVALEAIFGGLLLAAAWS